MVATGTIQFISDIKTLISTAVTSPTWRRELGNVPLAYHPGAGWSYGMSTDVLGYLVEVVSGVPFAEFLKTQILDPLGMTDTAFSVPDEKADRYATLYEPAEDGGIQVIENAPVSSGPRSFFHSGGAGLQSTAADYLRFCQMLLNDGELEWRSTAWKENR